MTVTQISSFILNRATATELDELVRAINMRRKQITKSTIRTLTKGDTVSFINNGNRVTGKVDKVGSKNIYVRVPAAIRDVIWKVPAPLIIQ